MRRVFTNRSWQQRLEEIGQIAAPIGESCLAGGAAIQADDCDGSRAHRNTRTPVRRAHSKLGRIPRDKALQEAGCM